MARNLMSQQDVPENRPPRYSVVIPCYRSEKSIGELLRRISETLAKLEVDYEVICVDDGSPDGLAGRIREIQNTDPRIRLIQHFQNYGQHHALLTGFEHVRGEFVITLDDDLQHPPEEIPTLINALGRADVIMGVPDSRHHKGHRNLGSRLIQLVMRWVFRTPKGYETSAFRLMRTQVARQLAASPTVYPFISGMIMQITRNITSVRVRHDLRKHGRSTYSLRKLVGLASNLVINYTKLPLQMLVGTGIIISAISFFMILYVVMSRLLIREFQTGWPSLIVVISFFGGLNLIGLAVIGEYLIRLLNEVERTKKPVIRKIWED